MQRMINFFKNVKYEMKKVTWPTRQELLRYTWVVLGTMVFFVVFFTVVDYGISSLIKIVLG